MILIAEMEQVGISKVKGSLGKDKKLQWIAKGTLM